MMVLLIDCLTCSSMANSDNGKMTLYRQSMRRKSRRIDVNRTSWAVGFDFFYNIPAGVGRQNNVVLTSMRRDDVALMSV